MTNDDLMRDLAGVSPDADDRVQVLRARLAVAARREGVLDISYRVIDSPVGPLLLAATEIGLVRVAFSREDHDAVLQHLSDSISPRILSGATRLDPAARELDDYFAGHRRAFDLPIDWQLSTGFRSTVLHLLPEIDYGHTVTYAVLAQSAGNPKAVRAVGSACANNPIPLVVPCHRVIRSDGSSGGYRGGMEAKRMLLELESA
jgi:methylated-DNA-[protein]-cysteine S-methyltransferase